MTKRRFIAGVALAEPDRARLLAAARNQSLTVVLGHRLIMAQPNAYGCKLD